MQVEKLKMETTENLKSIGNIFKIQCTYIHFWYALIRFGLVSGSYCILIPFWFGSIASKCARKEKKERKKTINENEWIRGLNIKRTVFTSQFLM